MDTGFPTLVRCLCLGLAFAVAPPLLAGVLGECAWVRILVSPHHSWLGFVVCAVGLGFWLATRHFWLGFWGVCGSVRAPRVLRQSWLGCAAWVGVPGLGSRLRPASSGWGVAVCGCVCVRSPRVPCHSWLGCAVWVCVLGLGFWLRPATPGWGVGVCVCLCARPSFTPPLLAGVLGCVGLCVRAPLVPRHSWLGRAVWVCVLGLGSRLRPTSPGWGVGVCVCLWARSPFTPPLLAGVCGVGLCAWARVLAAPHHSWLGCWGVCVFWARSACTLPLLAGVCGAGVCAWARVLAAPRHSWLWCWGLCVFVCTLPLYPATPGWGVRRGCVCLGSEFGCAPPLLAGVLGCVCVCGRAPLVPRHSWLGCAVWLCVLGIVFRLRRATPSWGVGACVLVCALRLYPASR